MRSYLRRTSCSRLPLSPAHCLTDVVHRQTGRQQAYASPGASFLNHLHLSRGFQGEYSLAALPVTSATFLLTQDLQGARRDSKIFFVVDEDCGIPVSIVENYQSFTELGPLAHSDPRSLLLSMSEYDKPQHYEVYGESSCPLPFALPPTRLPCDR